MKKELYILLRQGAIKEYREMVIDQIIDEYDFDYRTVSGLIDIIDNSDDLDNKTINTLLDKEFYSINNMIKLYREGFTDIIPSTFYENEIFLKECKITEIPNFFLANNKNLTEFHISEQIKSIGRAAFYGCEKLKGLTGAEKLEEIGKYAFAGCKSMDISELPESLERIGEGGFMGCESIIDLNIQAGITELKDNTFRGCTGLRYINVPLLKTVGDKCFKDCENLRDIGTVLSNIGKEAFSGCISLQGMELKDADVKKRAFLNCIDMSYIDFINKPCYIGEDAFVGCDVLQTIIFGDFSYKLHAFEGEKEVFRNIKVLTAEGKSVKLSKEFILQKKVINALRAVI